MPTRKAESYQFGGVDSRSNPANFPVGRSIRCVNWAPQASGGLRLRSGYTEIMNGTNDTAGATSIHSVLYYEQFSANAIGPQYLLYGKSASLFEFDVDNGVSTFIAAMPGSNPWGHFRAGNRIHLGDGIAITPYAKGPYPGPSFGFQNWDGTTLRATGIPTSVVSFIDPTSGSVFAVTATVSASALGSFAPTTLGGYQFYTAWYDPVTQHMGNCLPLTGGRVNIAATGSIVILQNLGIGFSIPVYGYFPQTQPYDPEWVTALGMSLDGGEVPYWLVDSNGNHIVVGNTATIATVEIGNVDIYAELPVRNDVPPGFDKFARVGTRLFANLSGSPYIYYSNDVSDVSNANYVGNPEESWPADQAEAFPTGELPTALHSYRFEGWFFSLRNLAIWSALLAAQGANPWRGPWPGGCAGQRAFVETPYGPYWLSGERQLCTFMDDGVISVSEEYELALLAKLAPATLSKVELGYLCDPSNLVDQIMISGLDANGNPVLVVHDFKLKDERSPFGCGYDVSYTGMTPGTFVGAGYTPRTNARDVNGQVRLWMGVHEGAIHQLEDGSNSDNGATYSADYIGLLNMGVNYPGLDELEFQGDPNVDVDYLLDYSQNSVAAFQAAPKDVMPPDSGFANPSRFGAKLSSEAKWMYLRLQLTAHPADGNFGLTDPPFLPMPSYGCVNASVLKLGAERKEAR